MFQIYLIWVNGRHSQESTLWSAFQIKYIITPIRQLCSVHFFKLNTSLVHFKTVSWDSYTLCGYLTEATEPIYQFIWFTQLRWNYGILQSCFSKTVKLSTTKLYFLRQSTRSVLRSLCYSTSGFRVVLVLVFCITQWILAFFFDRSHWLH